MNGVIAILEDNAGRCQQMRSCLMRLLPDIHPIFFESAYQMVGWLAEHQAEVVLMSLDYDLPIRRDAEGVLQDFGTGEIVADFLCARPVTCPVIIHSSNMVGADKMMRSLREHGWPVARVYPFDDLQWIRAEWMKQVTQYIEAGYVPLT